METIKVMVNGLPGNVARILTRHILSSQGFALIPYSLTGPEIEESECAIENSRIRLVRPERKESEIAGIKETQGGFLSVDYTHPSAVNQNGEFYCKYELPFVMGTTGGDRQKLAETVLSSSIVAVIAPNMAKPIVGLQAMMEIAADTFPDLFKGYSLEIKESHQKGKADTSGTAKAMAGYFRKLGVAYTEDQIIKVRDPQIQKSQLGVPEEYLSGHGYHTYTLVSEDQTVRLELTHNVNGREVYARGTLDALRYLSRKVADGARGAVYTMIDVLRGI
jgi:4-hydroxy-tetrahydrodipicolinate reductase